MPVIFLSHICYNPICPEAVLRSPPMIPLKSKKCFWEGVKQAPHKREYLKGTDHEIGPFSIFILVLICFHFNYETFYLAIWGHTNMPEV